MYFIIKGGMDKHIIDIKVFIPCDFPICYNSVGLLCCKAVVFIPCDFPICYNSEQYGEERIKVFIPCDFPICYNYHR